MKKYTEKLISFGISGTAIDTGVLFVGNTVSSFFSFLFTIIVARLLNVEDFGVFSAISNLTLIIMPLASLGVNYGLINYVSIARKKDNVEEENSYIKASLLTWSTVLILILIFIMIFSNYTAQKLLATNDKSLVIWTGLLSVGIFLWHFFPLILQARRRFFASVVAEGLVSLSRTVFIFILFILGVKNLSSFLSYYAIALVGVSVFVGYIVTRYSFLNIHLRKDIVYKLLKFSGWMGVSRIALGAAGRLDVQMLASMLGATATGFYSISVRLSSYLIMLATSFSVVMATRLSSYGDKTKEKKYLIKTTMFSFVVVFGVFLWIAVSRPFIVILFGEKYLPSVGIFRVLALSMVPYLVATPAMTAVTYSLKKTSLVGLFSLVQLGLIFILNLYLIPKFNVYGPAISIGIVHIIMLFFYWSILYKYYFVKD